MHAVKIIEGDKTRSEKGVARWVRFLPTTTPYLHWVTVLLDGWVVTNLMFYISSIDFIGGTGDPRLW